MADATIIPFPRQRAGATSAGPEDARLRVALEGLQTALIDQAGALAEWRLAMVELGVGVSALTSSAADYEAAMSGLDARVAGLHSAATVIGKL